MARQKVKRVRARKRNMSNTRGKLTKTTKRKRGKLMKLDFYKDEWDAILNNCDFTDIEIKIIELIRR